MMTGSVVSSISETAGSEISGSIYETGEPRCLGYSEYMHVLFAKRDGKNMPYQKINTSYIFPIFTEPEESGNIYIIAPIHSQGTVIGYGVFKNHFAILDNFFLYSWLRHLRIGLMRGRQNISMELMNRKLELFLPFFVIRTIAAMMSATNKMTHSANSTAIVFRRNWIRALFCSRDIEYPIK